MRDMLDEKLARFEELERQMSDPAVQADSGRISAVAREHGSLARLATKYRRFLAMNDEIRQLREMLGSDDPEEREMAELELPEMKERREELWNELLELTIGGQDANRTRCVLEIRAGTGGEEAALFARDLYEMYKKHAETKGWKVEVFYSNPTELGGLKEVSLALEGEGVYR